ncbi:MAG: hypothetical protein GY953_43540, partial [bacterium]|nr:hypothetical protein [bacterium]
FEEAVVDVLVAKAILAIRKTGLQRICVGGGVAANHRFREQFPRTYRHHRGILLRGPVQSRLRPFHTGFPTPTLRRSRGGT